MKRLILAAAAALAAGAGALAQDEPSAGPPAWFLEHVEYLSGGDGRWVADNSAYRGDEEPMEAYVIEWTSEFGGTSMTGRLFGMVDGERTGDFWAFTSYWDPADERVVAMQLGGGGSLGVGEMTYLGDGREQTDQTFNWADGRVSREGHVAVREDADTYVTTSFDIEDGAWTARRVYTWIRQAAPDP